MNYRSKVYGWQNRYSRGQRALTLHEPLDFSRPSLLRPWPVLVLTWVLETKKSKRWRVTFPKSWGLTKIIFTLHFYSIIVTVIIIIIIIFFFQYCNSMGKTTGARRHWENMLLCWKSYGLNACCGWGTIPGLCNFLILLHVSDFMSSSGSISVVPSFLLIYFIFKIYFKMCDYAITVVSSPCPLLPSTLNISSGPHCPL